jgi:uncharacterized protein (UPF0261 family)
VALLLPLRGVSMLDAEGQPFFDIEADNALFQSLRENASPNITIREIDAHINDLSFAHALADALLAELKSPLAPHAS